MRSLRGLTLCAVLLISGAVLTGCGADEDVAERSVALEELTEAAEVYSSLDDWLEELANDYLFKKADPEEKNTLREHILSLTPEDAKRFHQLVIEKGGFTGNQRASAEIIAAYMEEKGLMLTGLRYAEHGKELEARIHAGLTHSEDRSAEQQLRAACDFGYVPCSYVNYWNSYVTNGTCTPPGCVVGTLSDRTGNSACEGYDCDYRIRFTKTAATRIDGIGLAADCVLAYYGTLSSYSGAPYAYVGFGQGGPIACFLPTGAIHTNFVVW